MAAICPKCNGSGRFISYQGRDIGECFRCHGKGALETSVSSHSIKESVKPQGSTTYRLLSLPKTVAYALKNNVKIKYPSAKLAMTQDGRLLLVGHSFGDGVFGSFNKQTGEFASNKKTTSLMFKELMEVEEGGVEKLKEYGKLCGWCCVCGKTLTDETSIANGIGPICAGKGEF